MPHGALLLEFAEAAVGADDDRLARARDRVRATLGADALVDAAGVVASFNAVVRVASATGIELEPAKEVRTRALRADLGLDPAG